MKLPPKTTKLYAAGAFLLALALLVFVQAAFRLDPLFNPSEPNQIVLLVTLSTLIFLVLLVFGFVLLRNIVKVWAERKQQKPGSKFKTRILVSLVSLTLVTECVSYVGKPPISVHQLALVSIRDDRGLLTPTAWCSLRAAVASNL